VGTLIAAVDMQKEFVTRLVCPKDGHTPLAALPTSTSNGDILEGELECRTCGARFPVHAGIPSFVHFDKNEGEASLTKLREMESRDKSYARYEGRNAAIIDEWERFPELDALETLAGDCHGQAVFDAGCGVGKMTQVLRSAREIVATDFSFQALLHFGFDHPNMLLMQADVCRLPLVSGTFDLVMSSQVLEHIPDQQSRLQFMQGLAGVLKPGGKLILTVYNWDKNRQAHAVPKEGFHKSDIFYHCYTADELTSELGQFVKIEKLWGVQTVLPKTYRMVRALGSNYRYWDRLWRRTQIGRAYSNLLLAVGVKQ
jgi:SAM-dependent methyltransferase/uncharacterized protein YbaR (Trm112 family)